MGVVTGSLDRVGSAAFLRALHRAEMAPASSAMLATLAARAPGIVSYRELADAVYGAAAGPDYLIDTFRVLALRMRRRGVPIVTHHGRGYSLPGRPA